MLKKWRSRGAHPAIFAALVMAAAVACFPRPASLAATGEPVRTPIVVTVLGSGTPVPGRQQAGAAILVEAGEEFLLFDCGRGCTTRLSQYNPDLLTRVDKVFVTHLHSDHVVGLPDLWLNGWTQGRPNRLTVWGPAGTDQMMRGLQSAFAEDINSRTGTRGPFDREQSGAETRPVPPGGGLLFNSEGVSVTAFPVTHAGMEAFGYKIAYEGQSVVLSGDTTVTPELGRAAAGADILLLEVLSPAMEAYIRETFREGQAAKILGLHLTAEQAGRVLAESEPRLGVYYHTVASCETDPDLLSATREHFAGDVIVSRDLMQIRLGAAGAQVTYLGEDGTCASTTAD